MLRFFLLSFMVGLSSIAYSQTGRVIIRNIPEGGGVELKWYFEELIYPEGISIYRQQEGDIRWVKVNRSPVFGQQTIDPIHYEKEEDLYVWTNAVNHSIKERKPLDGLVYIKVLCKSFLSPVFSDFLGVRYLDHAIQYGLTYRYRVMKREGGLEIPLGTSQWLTADNYRPPPPVKGFSLKQEKSKVLFSWTPDEERFFAYHLYRMGDRDSKPVRLNDNPLVLSLQKDKQGDMAYQEVLFEDDSLEQESTYRYWLEGVDFFGARTEPTDTLTLYYHDYAAPEPPYQLTHRISAKKLKVYLQWQNSLDEDIQTLYIYRTADPDDAFERIAELKTGTNQYTDQLPKAGFYYYYMAAADAYGNEGKTQPIMLEMPDVIPPETPRNVQASADTGRLYLNWQANKEEDLRGYLVYRSVATGDSTHFILVNATPDPKPFLQQAMPKQVKNTFQYRIVAVDSAFNRSPMSDVAQARMPDVTPPASPRLLQALQVEKGIQINWKANADYDLYGYLLYRATQEDTFTVIHPGILRADRLSFTDEQAESGVSYRYRLVGVDSVGNFSEPSNILHCSLPEKNNEESAPQLKARFHKRKREVRLSWDPIVSDKFLGFVLMRKEMPEKAFSPLTGLMKSEDEFEDHSIQKGINYTYQLRTYWTTGKVGKSDLIELSIPK